MTTPVDHAKALYVALEHIAYPDGARLNANSMQRVAREAIAAYDAAHREAPSPPASIEAMVDELLPTIMHPEWAGNILAIGKLHKLISAFAARVAAEHPHLAEFSKHTNWSLSHRSPTFGDDFDQTERWEVIKQTGNRNDRELLVIGFGATPAEAITMAIRQSASEGKGT